MVFALVALVGLGSSGCVQTLQLVGASLELAGAIADASRASQASQPPPPEEPTAEPDTRVLSAEVDKSPGWPMSECELARGRWREAHQDQDVPPPELRCLADGAYPPAPRPPNAFVAPVDAEPPAPAATPPTNAAANPEML
ncbi:MAG: hypothetical protein U0441_01820 [Polyangiaceae bacterium]